MVSSLEHSAQAVQGDSRSEGAELLQLTFAAQAPAGVATAREFSQPRRAHALTVPLAPSSLARTVSAMGASTCVIALLSPESSAPLPESTRAKLAGESREMPKVSLKQGTELVEWWPGRALVRAGADARAHVLAALVDFMFYEGELRELEAIVAAGEERALADLQVGQRVRPRDRRRWNALFDAMQRFTRARLIFARLEPELSADLSSLPAPARRWLGRMYEAALVEDRAEALDDRLEALETFYEGATQRAADFRWYLEGRRLEVTIILILVLECLLMAGDIYLHFAHGR
jgi:hypothetical protein